MNLTARGRRLLALVAVTGAVIGAHLPAVLPWTGLVLR